MTCSFWTFPAHSSLITKHPHAPISCKLFRVSLSTSTFHVPKSQGPALRTGYVTAAQTPVPNCSSFSWASIWPCTPRTEGNRCPRPVCRKAAPVALTLAHSWCSPQPRLLPVPQTLPAGISCVCLGEEGEGGRGRAGLVVMREASQHAAFIRGTCWVINSQQRQTGEIFVPVWRARATGEIRKHGDGSNLAPFHQYTLLY